MSVVVFGGVAAMVMALVNDSSGFVADPRPFGQFRFARQPKAAKKVLGHFPSCRLVQNSGKNALFESGVALSGNAQDVDESYLAITEKPAISICFSHIQLFVDHVEPLDVYKALEQQLNHYDAAEKSSHLSLLERRQLWESIRGEAVKEDFAPENRDILKQLITGLGFRVTGHRCPSPSNSANTISLLLTSRDPGGVQIVVSSLSPPLRSMSDDFIHFDAGKSNPGD